MSDEMEPMNRLQVCYGCEHFRITTTHRPMCNYPSSWSDLLMRINDPKAKCPMLKWPGDTEDGHGKDER
jgi:hypothetical protein